ncbi:MAG: hypothetical protein H7210_00210 [Pyrinomonadaceae bacterium]|nr:hypothetical protein [Phycisphaerales bacterium]
MIPLPLPFAVQLVLAVAAFLIAPRIARASKPAWVGTSVVALGVLLCWPLLRVVPVQAIELMGARFVACIELTGLAVPAVLLFGVASRHLPRQSDRRAVLMLTAVAAIYFVKAGWWMVSPGVVGLGPTNIDGHGLCRQSTEYTCVAASMVTVLRARGIPAEETEMARLAYTQVGGGATDSRALWALESKLRGTELKPKYKRLDQAGLIAAAKPCMVQLDWGYFVSHMVPVMEASADRVVIGDPINGRREMTLQKFMAEWKGKAITVE